MHEEFAREIPEVLCIVPLSSKCSGRTKILHVVNCECPPNLYHLLIAEWWFVVTSLLFRWNLSKSSFSSAWPWHKSKHIQLFQMIKMTLQLSLFNRQNCVTFQTLKCQFLCTALSLWSAFGVCLQLFELLVSCHSVMCAGPIQIFQINLHHDGWSSFGQTHFSPPWPLWLDRTNVQKNATLKFFRHLCRLVIFLFAHMANDNDLLGRTCIDRCVILLSRGVARVLGTELGCMMCMWKQTELHHAKSHRPFELFVNENHKLWNEAKMNVMFERGSARDASAKSSLCWDEGCFYVKNRRASCAECYPLGNDFVTTIARVVSSRTNRLRGVVGRAKHAAVILCRRLVLGANLRDLLHYLRRVGLVATSPTRWEAYLLWMSHDPVSPAWGHSAHGQIAGKLGWIRALHSPPWQGSIGEARCACGRLGT